MALMFHPHSWTVATALQEVVDGKAMSPAYGGKKTVKGQVSGITSAVAIDTYNVQVTRGYEVLMDPCDADLHKVGDKILFKNLQLKVMTAPKVLNHGLPADHAAMLCEEIRNDA